MKRNTLLSLLNSYFPVSAEEQDFKKRMLDFIQKNENCFERSLQEGHITSSCWLIDKTGEHALLTHHAKLDAWFQLGGHCDGESDVLQVALKEAREESGINGIQPVSSTIFDIDIHLIPANSKEKAHYHYDVRFLLQVTSNEIIVVSNESKELRWISKNKTALPTQNIAVVRMFNKWLNLYKG